MENPRRFALSCVLLVLMLVTCALVLQVAADSRRGTAPHELAPSELEAPTNLAAVGFREGHIDLTWQDNSSDETNFVAEYSLDGVTGWSTATSGIAANATTVRIGVYDCESTYYYRIRAHRSGDNQYSDYSNVAGGTTGPCRPSNLMVTSVSESQITLGWTDNSSTETHFQIARSTDGSVNWDPPYATVGAGQTTYQDSMLRPAAPATTTASAPTVTATGRVRSQLPGQCRHPALSAGRPGGCHALPNHGAPDMGGPSTRRDRVQYRALARRYRRLDPGGHRSPQM